MKKKILFIITQSEFGGAQHFLSYLVPSLNKEKYEVVVGAGSEGDMENEILPRFALSTEPSFLDKEVINTKCLKYLSREVNPFFDFLALK